MGNDGKRVRVHYVGTLDNGEQFDSSRDRGEPLEFVCGAGQMIPGFDRAVRDMEPGQVITVRLEPQDAYGERRENLLREFPMERLPEHLRSLGVGEKVYLRGAGGRPIPATVAKVTPRGLLLDLNHELAGQALTFEIELLEVED